MGATLLRPAEVPSSTSHHQARPRFSIKPLLEHLSIDLQVTKTYWLDPCRSNLRSEIELPVSVVTKRHQLSLRSFGEVKTCKANNFCKMVKVHWAILLMQDPHTDETWRLVCWISRKTWMLANTFKHSHTKSQTTATSRAVRNKMVSVQMADITYSHRLLCSSKPAERTDQELL